MKNKLFVAAIALFALVACEKEQSYLELDKADVKMATVTGQVTYNPGGVDAKVQPADSVEVRVLVANAEFSQVHKVTSSSVRSLQTRTVCTKYLFL